MDQGMQMITERRKGTTSSWSLVSHASGSTAEAIGVPVLGALSSAHHHHQGSAQSFC